MQQSVVSTMPSKSGKTTKEVLSVVAPRAGNSFLTGFSRTLEYSSIQRGFEREPDSQMVTEGFDLEREFLGCQRSVGRTFLDFYCLRGGLDFVSSMK